MNTRDQIRARLPQLVTDLRAKTAERAPEALAAREAGYSIRNATGDEAVVRIYDEIWWLGVNAQDFASELDAITAPKIRVEINSPGGDVWDGVAIYNALRNHPAEVTTRIDGMAASIASIIFQAGDHRIIFDSSQMMIHNAWGMTVGDYRDHEDMANVLRQQNKVLAGIYAAHGTESAERYQELMDAETWMVGEEIIANGLADEIVAADVGAKNATPTLYQQIAEAVDAASRVDALREEAGKGLSNRNRECLVGLRDRLTALLDEEPNEAPIPTELADLYGRLYARRTTAPLPTGA